MTRNFPLIQCPYCFKKFPHDKVCFKAKTVFTNQDLESLGDEEIWDLDAAGASDKAVAGRAVMKKFIEKSDEKYIKFWKDYPDSEPEWAYRDYPVITPESLDMMDGSGGYRGDASGFTSSVVDCFGRESKLRICPECHNELPRGFGKYPVYTIAVVGITKSGKTVYLSYLMQNFGKYMGWAGLGARTMGENVSHFIEQNRVAKGEFLPQGTQPEHLSQPLFYLVRKESQAYTLVFYDIAGETCVKPDQMEKYGNFIRHADGIIFILDPEQFVQLREDPDREVLDPEVVLNAMSEAFLDADNEDGRTDKPLAVVLSKSDILRKKELSSESNVFRQIVYKKPGFQLDAHRDLSGELGCLLSRLSQGKIIIENINAFFNCYSLFAVSVLDGGVEKVEEETPQGEKIFRYKPMNSPSGIRVEEPVLWMLNKMNLILSFDSTKKKKTGWIRKVFERFSARKR